MKKRVLSLSIQAMLMGDRGQSSYCAAGILVVPYFNQHPSSVIHAVNEDTRTKGALKVRFRGAANSDDILDFTIFLSPGNFPNGKQITQNTAYPPKISRTGVIQ